MPGAVTALRSRPRICRPATYQYQVKIEIGGQQMSMKIATTIKDGGGAWTATDTMETPQGTATDTAIAREIEPDRAEAQRQTGAGHDRSGLQPATRQPARCTMNGQDKPIAVDLGGPLFADAAGGDQVIACLPLAEGYTTTFRNFDVQTQKVKLMPLNVAGVEKVTVPAGTFDAFRVELTSADGVRQEDAVDREGLAKSGEADGSAASMGGAVLTEELAE